VTWLLHSVLYSEPPAPVLNSLAKPFQENTSHVSRAGRLQYTWMAGLVLRLTVRGGIRYMG
jgi:hypothetical protein